MDPSVVFTVLVVLTPLVFVSSFTEALAYVLQPTWIVSVVLLVAIVSISRAGRPEKLSYWDSRVAHWFLCNGVYFNLFLDVVSGQFQLGGEMSKQYLTVEPRYAYGPFVCDGQSVF
jgi:hypothetical protein